MEHVDVIIVGAGLSGIGGPAISSASARKEFLVILEGREKMGGTWDLFRYPGVRSDSDMYTLGYRFRPWREAKAMADGPAILNYIRDTAAEYRVDKMIRYNHRVRRASWSSNDARWTVEAETGADNTVVQLTCNFLYLCTGYYDYESGYTPEWPGVTRFRGTIVHPQKWPEDLDYAGKRVVVIGSGATAVTLVPAMAERAAHVTMLQRSPSYVVSRPAEDKVAILLRRVLRTTPHTCSRGGKRALRDVLLQPRSKRPNVFKWMVARGVRTQLGKQYDEKHFTPPYNPWDQRLCLVPDADLFRTIREGRVSVVTDHIETFTEDGLLLKSGEHSTPTSSSRLQDSCSNYSAACNSSSTAHPSICQRRCLQRDDVQRRTPSRFRRRLHERLMDSEMRPRRRVRVQAVEPHGPPRLFHMHAAR